jgi:hypothetical protein
MLKSEIEVQMPDLFMEQYGVDRLFRITMARDSLELILTMETYWPSLPVFVKRTLMDQTVWQLLIRSWQQTNCHCYHHSNIIAEGCLTIRHHSRCRAIIVTDCFDAYLGDDVDFFRE